MIYQKAVLPALAAYGRKKGDDERALELALKTIRAIQHVPGLMPLLEFVTCALAKAKPRKVLGLTFPTPIGLAAGLDKEGVGLPLWQALGLGFVEVGTVTPYRQPGNPRPRLFLLEEEQELINRMGFNGGGMHSVLPNVARGKKRVSIPIGISLGKMKGTSDGDAHLDYEAVLTHFIALVDFLIANVSSPNTPGLRDIQKREIIETFCRQLVHRARSEEARLGLTKRPLLVKIAPDLTYPELDDIIGAVLAASVDGLVVANTTTTRPATFRQPLYDQTGGLSGHGWLFERAMDFCRHIRIQAPSLALILAGGISSPNMAARALDIADLAEVLTGFVFQGPRLVRDIRRVRGPGPAHLIPAQAAA